MIIPVKGLGEVGVVVDLPHNELPLNAWTHARNVRFRAGAVEKLAGHQEVFGTPLIPPEWLLFTTSGASAFWLYAGETAVGATNGVTHADITRTSGPYAMSSTSGWTGGLIEDIPVINNGTDVPQMWNKPALDKKLEDLPNWPATMTANALRVFKRYLVALDVSKAGLRYPTMVKWSHQAPTGNVPDNWDEADPTVDAAEYTLPGAGGYVVDAMPLRDVMIVYKEFQTWVMTYTGGQDIFRFTRLFGNVGCLSRRSAVEYFSGKHLVFTGDDLVSHDGHQAQSVLDERGRKLLQDAIDPGFVNKAFLAVNYPKSEVWVCVPEQGQSYATRALIWSWKKGSIGFRDLPGASFIETGLVAPQSVTKTWAGVGGTWNSAEAQVSWGDRATDPTKQRLLIASPGDTKLYVPETGESAAGTAMTVSVERRGIGFPLKTQSPPDFTSKKQILSIYPHITGTAGGTIRVSLGTQDTHEGPVTWRQTRVFRIGSTEFCDFADVDASRLHALRFESSSDITWRLASYDADVVYRGDH